MTVASYPSWRDKLTALYRVVSYRPKFFLVIFGLSVATALFEGIGLSFILPILRVAGGTISAGEADGILQLFLILYRFFGIPFTLGYLVLGISFIMTIRYTLSFLTTWSIEAIRIRYLKYLQQSAYDQAINASISYYDSQTSDRILDTIVTQSTTACTVVKDVLILLQTLLTSVIYMTIALVLAPKLSVGVGVFFVVLTAVFQNILTSGYSLGDVVADSKEEIQSIAQSGIQGIREVKMLGISGELSRRFEDVTEQFVTYRIKSQRNNQIIQQYYQLTTALTVFILVYLGVRFSSMSLSELGVFLFAMFRLGPRASTLNSQLYSIENKLPHLVRVQDFIDELERQRERAGGSHPVPDQVEIIEFEDVSFRYKGVDEMVLTDVSFSFETGEFVAFVGSSGAGKSTIASLLAGLYEPDSGRILIDGTPLGAFPLAEWRSQVAIVRQDPYIFNATLQANITIGRPDAAREEVERACETSGVTEFLTDLPGGYETELGDDGIRLSGGQRQRVAIARALLQDAQVLVLDEATSDLDTSLERRVQSAIESTEQDYAMLTIAHRLSTVRNADRIYMIEGGEVIERGNHNELLVERGAYASLYTAQSEDVQ